MNFDSIYSWLPGLEDCVNSSIYRDQVTHIELKSNEFWSDELINQVHGGVTDKPITEGQLGHKQLPFLLVRYIDDTWNTAHNNLKETKSFTLIQIGIIPNCGPSYFTETVRARETKTDHPTITTEDLGMDDFHATLEKIKGLVNQSFLSQRLA